MTTVVQFTDATFDSSLPTLAINDNDLKLAAVNSLTFWLDPLPAMRSANNFKDRIGGKLIKPASATGDYPVASNINGGDALSLSNAGVMPYIPESGAEFALNQNEWTVAFVIKRDASDAAVSTLTGKYGSAPVASDRILNIGFGSSGDNIRLYRGTTGNSGDVRLSSTGVSFLGQTRIVMITFNTTTGLKLYIDGVLNVSNATDKDALTSGIFQFLTNGTGTAGAAGSFSGLLGSFLAFSADLSLAPRLQDKLIVENYFKTKYSI
ncbi:LamG-like jellyroll fold domain-containing protein [Acinetobacter soli]|uniref:LamG-like jellyroll fold domain-containing protein n=1 Tax=Acinetobacter soli NIPH 2899 TaxID=1217677 RepID=A0ABN0JXT4_9GAMM|nr:LamG-like jellyroll fold domain-containing protein [Acinetobacter soli]ENV60376.1 hypothetical protein F950_02938 [Acinetobacter soli NIPH 2899]